MDLVTNSIRRKKKEKELSYAEDNLPCQFSPLTAIFLALHNHKSLSQTNN